MVAIYQKPLAPRIELRKTIYSENYPDKIHYVGNQRIRLELSGKVQGVGMRPFLYSLAQRLHLSGYTLNSGSSVIVEVEGDYKAIESFHNELHRAPLPIQIDYQKKYVLPEKNDRNFEILESQEQNLMVSPPLDLATCEDCLREMRDPDNRRFQYPFIHCSACGPRWSVLEKSPYDRAHTTMRDFPLCQECESEYTDPGSRRFHAQAVSCFQCGPSLNFEGAHTLQGIAAELKRGKILALKGVGGYQLWAVTSQENAIKELRKRKNRPDKPFAIMVPELSFVSNHCYISEVEKQWVEHPSAPIVLLRKKSTRQYSEKISALSELGVMLANSPIQSLLLLELQEPVIVTSANISGEPIITREEDLPFQLADIFIHHNRRIHRPLDDSVLRVVNNKVQVLRLGRGLAPHQIWRNEILPSAIAVGADHKNAIAISNQHGMLLGHYQNGLSSKRGIQEFQHTIRDLQPENPIWIRDLSPDSRAGTFAPENSLRVPHHQAHALACIAEHNISFPVLAIAWDGNGYGQNGENWGSEFLCLHSPQNCKRIASLRSFPLLGGDAATLDPKRIAFALLWESALQEEFSRFGFTPEEIEIWSQMCKMKRTETSSMGRLFDGVSALEDLFHGRYKKPTYDGHAAMKLKGPDHCTDAYKLELDLDQKLDWRPMIRSMVMDLKKGIPISGKFHSALVRCYGFLKSQDLGVRNIVLVGGCFQNRFLLEGSIEFLSALGFNVFWPERIPTNDGGIAVGQLYYGLKVE